MRVKRQRWNSGCDHEGRHRATHLASLAVLPSRRQAFSLSRASPRSFQVGEQHALLRIARRPGKSSAVSLAIECRLCRRISFVRAWRPVDGASFQSLLWNIERGAPERGQGCDERRQHLAHGRLGFGRRAAGFRQRRVRRLCSWSGWIATENRSAPSRTSSPTCKAPILSPQGDRVALQINAGETDIWVLDLARGVRTRLTFGPVGNTSPQLVARWQMDRLLLRSQRPLSASTASPPTAAARKNSAQRR